MPACDPSLKEGDCVRARYRATRAGTVGTSWFPGVIAKVHTDSTYDIAYDDGDFESNVWAKFVRPAASVIKSEITPPPAPAATARPAAEKLEIKSCVLRQKRKAPERLEPTMDPRKRPQVGSQFQGKPAKDDDSEVMVEDSC